MNATGNVYEADVKEVKELMQKAMAYTNIHAITATVSKAVDYICTLTKPMSAY